MRDMFNMSWVHAELGLLEEAWGAAGMRIENSMGQA
jgi:hypothetical protein